MAFSGMDVLLDEEQIEASYSICKFIAEVRQPGQSLSTEDFNELVLLWSVRNPGIVDELGEDRFQDMCEFAHELFCLHMTDDEREMN